MEYHPNILKTTDQYSISTCSCNMLCSWIVDTFCQRWIESIEPKTKNWTETVLNLSLWRLTQWDRERDKSRISLYPLIVRCYFITLFLLLLDIKQSLLLVDFWKLYIHNWMKRTSQEKHFAKTSPNEWKQFHFTSLYNNTIIFILNLFGWDFGLH